MRGLWCSVKLLATIGAVVTLVLLSCLAFWGLAIWGLDTLAR